MSALHSHVIQTGYHTSADLEASVPPWALASGAFWFFAVLRRCLLVAEISRCIPFMLIWLDSFFGSDSRLQPGRC